MIIWKLEEKIIELGGREIAADPSEENAVSIKVLLSNGFKKKSDGDYRKLCIPSKCVAHQIRSEKGCRNGNLFIYLFRIFRMVVLTPVE